MSTSTNSMDSSDLKPAEKSGETNVTGTQRKITVLLILVVVNITEFSSAQRQSNRWDSNACHNDIKISDDKILTVLQKEDMDLFSLSRTGTYTFSNYGNFWANGSRKGTTVQFSGGDVVGFGVNLATRQIFFTKNGQHLGVAVFVAASPTDVTFFPFISLLHYNDKIEANFGPNFKFDLSTL
ncbi:hypothetical protein niasHS_015397 [Heterodera schachtii]|uniref:B30.2/SPRY domain-containing protein n=1 Tax=Heterodera schachtii TaxID=97005 RepID=A0ABD2I288_HETSC